METIHIDGNNSYLLIKFYVQLNSQYRKFVKFKEKFKTEQVLNILITYKYTFLNVYQASGYKNFVILVQLKDNYYLVIHFFVAEFLKHNIF